MSLSRLWRLVVSVYLLQGLVLYGQQNLGQIIGSVKDPSGSLVAGADLSAKQEETGLETRAVTNGEGVYTFPGLGVGTYKIKVTAPGFKTIERDNVRVVVGETITLDFDLTVGETSQITTVTSEVPLVDAKSTAIATSRTSEEIKDLPLQISGQDRNYLGYLLTLPGISYNPYSKSQATYDGLARAVIQGVGVNGFSNNVFSYNLDGVSGISFSNSGIEDAAAPLPELVEEFRMTTNPNAEQGANLGVGFDLVMKSGTNQFHGSLFEYLRNDALDSRNWFAASVSPLKQNQYGLVVGGPVLIPKLYNGKNRTFFFGSYDGFKLRGIGQGQTAIVPTARMRNGDFGELLGAQIGTDAAGRPVNAGEVFDPATTRAAGNSFVRDPFPNNIVPVSRQSSISRTFQDGYPLPTLPGLGTNWVGPRAPQVSNIDRMSQKVDHQITQNHRISVADEVVFRKTQDNSFIFAPTIRDTEIVDQKLYRFRFNYSWIVTPNVLFNVRTSYTRGTWDAGPDGTVSATYAQVAGLTKGLNATYTPLTTIDGVTGFGSRYAKFLRIGTGAPINTDLSWSKGHHNFKFGAEFLQQIMTNVSSTGTSGVYHFADLGTNAPNLTGSGAGYASFLLGDVNDGSLSTFRDVKTTARRWGFYAQDSWRMTPKLTVNYGVRYDLVNPLRESHNRLGAFNPGVINPAAGGLPGALSFWGNGPGRNGRTGIDDVYLGAIGPRLGLAYALNDKTNIRAYYGILYSPLNSNFVQGENTTNYGWAATVGTATLNNGVSPAFNWNNGFPPVIPPLPNLDPSSLNGSGVTFFGGDGGKKAARSQNIGFSLERTLPGQFVVRTEYVGKLVHGLTQSLPWNQLDLKYLGLGNLLNAAADSPQAVAAGIKIPFPGFVGSVAQSLRPFPQFLDISEADSTQGFSTYHALEVTVQRRWSDMTFLASYTASKLIFGGSFQDQQLRTTRKQLASQDRPQMLNLSYSYDLPFGHGKKFLNNSNPVLQHSLGGWRLAAIQNYFAGFPVIVSSRATVPSVGAAWPVLNSSVPVSTGLGCSSYNPTDPSKRYLNLSAFSAPAPFTFGNVRTIPNVRDCPALNENLTVQKDFTLRESVTLQFGAEVFNLFNRHQWFGLNQDTGNAAAFGTFASASDPRTVQFHLKLNF